MDSRIYQDPDKADADEVLNLSDDVAQQAQSVFQLSALVESQAQEVQQLQDQLSSLSEDLTSLQDSVSRVEVNSNIKKVSFMDVNANDCPGMTITTPEGRRVGIFAQAGLGFVLYDYTNQKRIGLCSFD